MLFRLFSVFFLAILAAGLPYPFLHMCLAAVIRRLPVVFLDFGLDMADGGVA